MAGKMTPKGEIVRDYCKQFPKWKDYTLAGKIYRENPKVFRNLEDARNLVRYQRGHISPRNRTLIADKSNLKPITNDTTNQKPFKEEINTGAKILILDIETAPLKVYTWNVWNQNIAPNQIESDWFIITWAAKWLFEDKVYGGRLTVDEVLAEDDKRIMHSLWEMVNQADIVVAHNGERFDIPRINTRFIIHGFMPPLPYQQIDTLKHIRRNFAFVHNKLDYVNQLLNLPRKIANEGMPLWVSCVKGDEQALQTMFDYNVGDVRILEDTYLRLRPWIKPHPQTGLHILDGIQRCPTCGSSNLINEGKGYHTISNIYELFRCDNCGSVSRARTGSIHIDKRRALLISSAR